MSDLGVTVGVDEASLDALVELYERDGVLEPAAVVAEAASPTSPLHSHFVWDNSVAADRYRRIQAGRLISSPQLRIRIEPERTISVPRFTRVAESGGYVSTDEAITQHREEVLQRLLRDLSALRRRYQHLLDFDAALRQAAEESAA